MRWQPGLCNDKKVWVAVDEHGRPVVQAGRVPVRYTEAPGAKVYTASPGNVRVGEGPAVELDAGAAPGAPAARGRAGSGFGSAGTRTAAQATAARAAAGALVQGFAADAAVAFTDGACKGNPGPAGSGAVLRLPSGEVRERWAALGRGTNNQAELHAVHLALDLLDEAGWPAEAAVELLTDSQYSHGVLCLGWKAKANQEQIAALRTRLGRRRHRMHWVAGHVGIPENERADALANLGVAQSARG